VITLRTQLNWYRPVFCQSRQSEQVQNFYNQSSWVRSGGVITWKTSSDPVSSREPIVAHQFQGQMLRSQTHIVCYVHTSHLCLFFIRETKCCSCVITGGRGHTVSAEPGGHTACSYYLLPRRGEIENRVKTELVSWFSWVEFDRALWSLLRLNSTQLETQPNVQNHRTCHNWNSWVELSSKPVITAPDRTRLNQLSRHELCSVGRCDQGLTRCGQREQLRQGRCTVGEKRGGALWRVRIYHIG